ncbi:unnamed protein product [Hapterophycus canaliculatus]
MGHWVDAILCLGPRSGDAIAQELCCKENSWSYSPSPRAPVASTVVSALSDPRMPSSCHFPHTATAFSKGAGKTTLLNALGGRATYGEVSGAVTLGEHPLTSQDLNYVPQFDDHNERFSPREVLTYMKQLKVRSF